MTRPVRVLIADCHAVAREGLKAVLAGQPDLVVCGEAADGPTAVALAGESGADVVVTEARQPGLDGGELASRLGATRRVLILAACEEPATVRRLIAAGAAGYVFKRSAADTVVRAVRTVAAGREFLDPGAGSVTGHAAAAGPPGLSEREVHVLRMVAQGYSNKEIAARLHLSVKTVETYKGAVAGEAGDPQPGGRRPARLPVRVAGRRGGGRRDRGGPPAGRRGLIRP